VERSLYFVFVLVLVSSYAKALPLGLQRGYGFLSPALLSEGQIAIPQTQGKSEVSARSSAPAVSPVEASEVTAARVRTDVIGRGRVDRVGKGVGKRVRRHIEGSLMPQARELAGLALQLEGRMNLALIAAGEKTSNAVEEEHAGIVAVEAYSYGIDKSVVRGIAVQL